MEISKQAYFKKCINLQLDYYVHFIFSGVIEDETVNHESLVSCFYSFWERYITFGH